MTRDAVDATGDPTALDQPAPIDRVRFADEIAFFGWLARAADTPTSWRDLAASDGSTALRGRL